MRLFILVVMVALSQLGTSSTAAAAPLNSTIGLQPVLGAPSAWTPPVPQRSTTAGGTRVLVLPHADVPLVHIAVVLQGGADLDPPSRPGLANAVATMLAEGGAGTRSGNELVSAMAALGDEPNMFTTRDGSVLLFTVQTRNFDPALALLADMLARPRFAEADWTRTRARLMAEAVRRRDEPRDIVDLVDNRVLFGDDHPYGRPTRGTADSLGATTVDELRVFYAQHYGPRTLSFVLTGNVPVDATKKIGDALAGWSSTALPPPAPPSPRSRGGRLVLIDRPGAQQSMVRVSQLGIARDSRDYPSAQVLAMVLAGSFTSRLTQNLREKHGYTYGVSAHYDTQRAPGPFVIESAIRTDVTAPALKELVDELTRVHVPLDSDELAKARALLRNNMVNAFGNNGGALLRLVDLVMHGLPPESAARELAALKALTPAQIADRSRTLINPTDGLTIVIVGDRAKIEAPLLALGLWKTIEHRDVDGSLDPRSSDLQAPSTR